MSGFSVSNPDRKDIGFSFSRPTDNPYNRPSYYLKNQNSLKMPYGFVGQGSGGDSSGGSYRPTTLHLDLTDISPETKQFTLYPPRVIKDKNGKPITSIDGKPLVDPGTIHKKTLDKKPKPKGKLTAQIPTMAHDSPNELWYNDRHPNGVEENPLAPPSTFEEFFGPYLGLNSRVQKEEIQFEKESLIIASRMEKIQTHYYDEYINNGIKFVQDIIDWSKDVSPDERIFYYNRLKASLSQEALECFEIVVKDSGTNANFFIVYADHILYILARFANDLLLENVGKDDKLNLSIRKHLIENLNAQFIEMKTGACPQGRVNRLSQILFATESMLRADQLLDEITSAIRDKKRKLVLDPSWSSVALVTTKETLADIMYLTRFHVWNHRGIYIKLEVDDGDQKKKKERVEEVEEKETTKFETTLNVFRLNCNIIDPIDKSQVRVNIATEWFKQLEEKIELCKKSRLASDNNCMTTPEEPTYGFSDSEFVAVLTFSKKIMLERTEGKYTIDHEGRLLSLEGIYL